MRTKLEYSEIVKSYICEKETQKFSEITVTNLQEKTWKIVFI